MLFGQRVLPVLCSMRGWGMGLSRVDSGYSSSKYGTPFSGHPLLSGCLVHGHFPALAQCLAHG